MSSFSSLIAVITLVVAFCYTSTGTDAEFDELKALVEKYMSEKDAHDTAVKVMTEAEAVRSRERQEQSDAVEQATLEILNRNAEAILPNPDGSDGYNLFESFDLDYSQAPVGAASSGVAISQAPTQLSVTSSPNRSGVNPLLQGLSVPTTPASSTASKSTPDKSTSSSAFVNKRAKTGAPSTNEILEKLLDDDTVADVVAAKDQAISLA